MKTEDEYRKKIIELFKSHGIAGCLTWEDPTTTAIDLWIRDSGQGRIEIELKGQSYRSHFLELCQRMPEIMERIKIAQMTEALTQQP